MIIPTLCSLLSAFYLVAFAQIGEIPVPPEVVQDHAQEVLTSEPSNACEKACARIGAQYPAKAELSPSLGTYFWSGTQGQLTPACQVKPTSDDEVVFVYNVVKEEKCPFAIKSGGHMRTPGTSSTDGGVLIDLASISQVDISKDQKSVVVGAGAQWIDVYQPLEKHGLSVVGGRVADVGVGGLLTGGGISYWTNRHGLACDNILSYSIVLPNGTLATVSPSQHPTLFRALRGAGSSNFGIITSFELKIVPLPNPAGIWQDWGVRDFSNVSTLLDLQHDLLTKGTISDLDFAYVNAYAYNPEYESWMSVPHLFHTNYHGSDDGHPEVFDGYYKDTLTPAIADTTIRKVTPYSNITDFLRNANPKYGARNSYTTFTHQPSREFEGKMLEIFKDEVLKLAKHNVSGLFPVMVWQPLYNSAFQHVSTANQNALGFTRDDAKNGPLHIFLLPFSWTNAEDDKIVEPVIKSIMSRGEALAKQMGVYHPWKYLNYAEGWQDVTAGYQGVNGDNLSWLRRVQKEYDPEGIYVKGGLAGGFFKFNDKEEGAGQKMVEDVKKVVQKMMPKEKNHDEL